LPRLGFEDVDAHGLRPFYFEIDRCGPRLGAKARIKPRLDHEAFELHDVLFRYREPFTLSWRGPRGLPARPRSAGRCRNATPAMRCTDGSGRFGRSDCTT